MSSCLNVLRRISRKNCRLLRYVSSEASQNHVKNPQEPNVSEQDTHFGFQTVTESEKAQKVYEVFADVASSYDRMNDAMSLGIHRLWKDTFVNRLAPTPQLNILDVAGGTGDIAFRIAGYQRSVYGSVGLLTVCDINAEMLAVGRERAVKLGLEHVKWQQGDAQDLTEHKDDSYDAYTIAFGIRNVVHIDAALKEAYRVLKPGGRFLCLEFSHVRNDVVRCGRPKIGQ
ncbi:hypothetical protein B566_EDAN004289 [Ephemera danica]|nr:hypothetical protein B566_EDAN004289 [Ephemera danica]